MYFDEDLILDLRLNYLYNHVDYFVIVESKFNHNGEERKPLFDINKFKDFKDKIIYLLLELGEKIFIKLENMMIIIKLQVKI